MTKTLDEKANTIFNLVKNVAKEFEGKFVPASMPIYFKGKNGMKLSYVPMGKMVEFGALYGIDEFGIGGMVGQRWQVHKGWDLYTKGDKFISEQLANIEMIFDIVLKECEVLIFDKKKTIGNYNLKDLATAMGNLTDAVLSNESPEWINELHCRVYEEQEKLNEDEEPPKHL
jgi:hypothetical protein